ncbi:thioredoxin [bacterium]|nr:thioredoxin [bacterium]
MSSLAEFNDANFDKEVLESGIPVLVDFGAEWCGPCKKLHPIVEELSSEYNGKIKTGYFDIGVSTNTPAKLGIMSVPTVILFKNGAEAKKIIGLTTKKKLVKMIEEVL